MAGVAVTHEERLEALKAQLDVNDKHLDELDRTVATLFEHMERTVVQQERTVRASKHLGNSLADLNERVRKLERQMEGRDENDTERPPKPEVQ